MNRVEELKKLIKPWDKDKPYVFVSYSKKDAEKVYSTIVKLQEDGYNIWIDKALESAVGIAWQTKALGAIKSYYCKSLLFFASENSMCSTPVCAELYFSQQSEAVRRNNGDKPMKIIPIVVSDTWAPQMKPLSEWVTNDLCLSSENQNGHLKRSDYEMLKAVNVESHFINPDSSDKLESQANISYFILKNVLEPLGGDQVTFANVGDLETIKKNIDLKCRVTNMEETEPVKSQPEPVKETQPSANTAQPAISTEQINVKKTERTGKKTQEREEFQPEPVEPFDFPANGTLTIGAVRERLATDLDFCKKLGDIRRTQLLYGGKSYMDYGMAAILKGCNKVVEPYQINYYNYCVANPDKVSAAKVAATWTWSSNARKIIGFVGSGMLDSKINALFESFPETMTINDLLSSFQKCCEEAYITKKNNLVIDGILKLLRLF